MTHIREEELAALSALVLNEPRKALALLREYDKQVAGDSNYWRNSGGFLIDIGDALGHASLVEEGIASGADST